MFYVKDLQNIAGVSFSCWAHQDQMTLVLFPVLPQVACKVLRGHTTTLHFILKYANSECSYWETFVAVGKTVFQS